MTDERLIEPRDGDIVRAKRGEYGVVEGVFHSYPISSGWGIGSEAEEDGLFAWNDKGWTITDILATPEPAPIEVGDWWADEGGWPCVVVKIGPTGNPFLRRWTSEHPDKAPSPETLRAAWTRLDGPPEPPVGSVVWAHGQRWHRVDDDGMGWMAEDGTGTYLAWSYLATATDLRLLWAPETATLRILGSVD